MALTTTIETIGLKLAKEYLDANIVYERGVEDTNRPVSTRIVNDYAKVMLAGEWRLTHQGLAFDSKGHLKDGQHRLMALVQACEFGAMEGEQQIKPNPALKVKFMVTRGLDNDIFAFLDNGRARSGGSVLAMSGYSSVSHLAAASRLFYLYDNYSPKFWHNTKVTNQQILATANEYHVAEYMAIGSSLLQVGMISSAATVGYMICERAWPEGPHMEFIEGLRDGVDLQSDSPALVLRNYLIRSRSVARVRRDSFTHLALYIKAWNDYATGKRRSSISIRSNEPFPIPVENGK